MLTGKELGVAIAKAIALKGVTQADVARHFGIKPPSVNGWIETGRIGKDRLFKLFDYFADVVGAEHWGIASSQDDPALQALNRRYQDADPTKQAALSDLASLPDAAAADLAPILAALKHKYQPPP